VLLVYRVDRFSRRLSDLLDLLDLDHAGVASATAIAAQLNAGGTTSRTGTPWSGLQVGRVLANPAYAGDIIRGDICVPDAYPALIDRATFQRA
jgi:hypothetical protein